MTVGRKSNMRKHMASNSDPIDGSYEAKDKSIHSLFDCRDNENDDRFDIYLLFAKVPAGRFAIVYW